MLRTPKNRETYQRKWCEIYKLQWPKPRKPKFSYPDAREKLPVTIDALTYRGQKHQQLKDACARRLFTSHSGQVENYRIKVIR